MWPTVGNNSHTGSGVVTLCADAPTQGSRTKKPCRHKKPPALTPRDSTAAGHAAHTQQESKNLTMGGDSLGLSSPQVTFSADHSRPEAIRVGTWIKQMPTILEDDDTGNGANNPENCLRKDEEDMEREDLGDPMELADNFERSGEIISKLEAASSAGKRDIIMWLEGTVLTLAQSKHGCRVVQKALEVASSTSRDMLVAELEPHAVMLYESLHGNYVLSKLVETMPSAALQPIIKQLHARGPIVVAKHRFGCRVLERLIEHCSEHEIGPLIDPIISSSEMLCRHSYGNFVIQHLFEQGAPARRLDILSQLLHAVPYLAMHRTASHVIQRLLEYCDRESLHMIIATLLNSQSPTSFVEVACNRYGSVVTEQLTDLRFRTPECFTKVHCYLAENVEMLGQGQYGKRVAERFGLEVPSLVALSPAVPETCA